MKNKKTAAVALSLAALMACGTLAGCDLVTTNSRKDMAQVVAEVDISTHENFQEGGAYAKYAEVIQPTTIIKRELVATFVSSGYSVMQQAGWDYSETFAAIVDSLVNRQIYLQYAMVYLFENGSYDDEGNPVTYTVNAYTTYVENAKRAAEEAGYTKEVVTMIGATAGYSYFLTQKERDKTDYDLKVTFNNTLDSQEESIITAEEEDYDHSNDPTRTLPTGANTEDEDYYNPAYKIYTATGSKSDVASPNASECGNYETVEDSTPTSRKRAYGSFLSNLYSNNLISRGEDTTRFHTLGYYHLERKSAFESALINKLTDTFEKVAETELTADNYQWVKDLFARTKTAQEGAYSGNTDAFESALDSVSDSNFLFYTPDDAYGFVINILLPFTEKQSEALDDADIDFGDEKGNKFYARAKILERLTATDQRGAWFFGHEDYFYEAEASEAYTGTTSNSADRKYLFFKEGIADPTTGETGTRYSAIRNYYGKYAYNGTAVEDEDGHYKPKPASITIDDFIAEMEGYLTFAGLGASGAKKMPFGYYDQTDFYDGGKVDYSKFIYYTGSVGIDNYDINNVFKIGSAENKALSVINELSFAYNTDTAGLNGYLGYAVSPYSTSFVKEFEYAAQEAIRMGAGSYTIAPSDYGWHIMYCTFSYHDGDYVFDENDVENEGSFSYMYFEALKSSTASNYSEAERTRAVNVYGGCVKVYEKRYSDLSSLGK